MREFAALLLIGAIIAAVFAFSGAFNSYPLYYAPASVAPYEFARFLFWMFILLFLASLMLGPTRRRPLNISRELNVQESTIVSGFEVALFFIVIAAISGLFGFGAIASAMAGLAIIIFWIAIGLGLAAMIMGLWDHHSRPRR